MKQKAWFIGLNVGLLVVLLVLTPALIISPPFGENGWYRYRLYGHDVFIVIDDLNLRFYNSAIRNSPNQELEFIRRDGVVVMAKLVGDDMERMELNFATTSLQVINYNDAGDIELQIEYQKIRNPFVIYYYWIKWRLD